MSHSVNLVLGTLKVMGENRERTYLKNSNNADEIIQKIANYSKICKREKQDRNLSKGDFHTTVVKPLIHALIEEMKTAFNISNLPVLNAFLKLDSQGIDNESPVK